MLQDTQSTLQTRSERESQQTYIQALSTLFGRLQGELLLPGLPEFQTARTVWNNLADRHPALIVYCVNANDVIAAIDFAREQGLAVSIRSSGHSMAGHSTNDNGIVIDLSRMKAITIDAQERIARLEPGLTWGEVTSALQPHGLALTSGDVSSVGVGGLILGGGIGWMVRKYGLTIDQLRAVELVTADGTLLRASATEHAELFWGLRGGGGNFGIVTAVEVNLHPGEIMLGGAILYDFADAEKILPAYARYAFAAPDKLTTMAIFTAAPVAPFIPPDKQGKLMITIAVCYAGDIQEGERVVAPLQHLATPFISMIAPMPYSAILAQGDEGTVRGLSHQVRSHFLKTLNDETLLALAETLRANMSSTTMAQFRILGGAMSRVDNEATAFAHRKKEAFFIVTNFGPDSADGLIRSERIRQALQPYADGVYIGFMAENEQHRIHEAYPLATYERLVALKNRYDPTNLFHHNQNIVPAP